jgi:hypothetical protein
MTYSARVLLDSVSPAGVRVTTMSWTYPRFIHSEVLTYRMFSRNAASSRAIPLSKTIRAVCKNPAGPVAWGQNQKGMQARSDLHGWRRWSAIQLWYKARFLMIAVAWLMSLLPLHKQIANRLLEPWSWITVIITANEAAYLHCFRQRVHPDAQPEFRHIAMLARREFTGSTPIERILHAPLMTEADYVDMSVVGLSGPEQHAAIWQISTARCARVSYLTHDGRRAIPEDMRLYRDLKHADPPHTSPFEHVLTASEDPTRCSGNVVGWIQHRETVEAA